MLLKHSTLVALLGFGIPAATMAKSSMPSRVRCEAFEIMDCGDTGGGTSICTGGSLRDPYPVIFDLHARRFRAGPYRGVIASVTEKTGGLVEIFLAGPPELAGKYTIVDQWRFAWRDDRHYKCKILAGGLRQRSIL